MGVLHIAYPRGKTEIHPLLWSGISAVTPADMNDRIDVLAEQIGIHSKPKSFLELLPCGHFS